MGAANFLLRFKYFACRVGGVLTDTSCVVQKFAFSLWRISYMCIVEMLRDQLQLCQNAIAFGLVVDCVKFFNVFLSFVCLVV
jgi:hypothetical protein